MWLQNLFINLFTVSDLEFSKINFDETWDYLSEENEYDHNSKVYISDLRLSCKKIVLFIQY